MCCLDVQGPDARRTAEAFIDDSRESDRTIAVAKDFLQEACTRRDESDELLARYARHWELARLALVDRNILRLAVCEMLSRTTGPRIVISEALRLAEEFSTAESPRFVNGILDAVYKDIHRTTE